MADGLAKREHRNQEGSLTFGFDAWVGMRRSIDSEEARHWKSGGRPGSQGTELIGHGFAMSVKMRVERTAQGSGDMGSARPQSGTDLLWRALYQPQARLCRGVLPLGLTWALSQCIMEEGFLIP